MKDCKWKAPGNHWAPREAQERDLGYRLESYRQIDLKKKKRQYFKAKE